MKPAFKQSVTFRLDKPHFIECFKQSMPPVALKDYRKAMILAGLGLALMFIESDDYYVAYFLLALALVEVFSVEYRQAWWVWRQLMSKSAQSQVTLTIDEQGITTESQHINNQLLWRDITHIEQTELGLLMRHGGGVNYLSNSHLNETIIGFILQQKSDDLAEKIQSSNDVKNKF